MRRLSGLMTALIILVLFTSSVCADAAYSITVHDSTEYAVFTVVYTGSVSALSITSPSGVAYNAGNAGSAYKVSDGKIQIGVRYAEAGKWKISITGSPDDGFSTVVSSDSSYGSFAGSAPLPTETTVAPTPTTAPTVIPTIAPTTIATPIPTQAPAPTQAPTQTQPVPTKSPVPSNTTTNNTSQSVSSSIPVVESAETTIPVDASITEQTIPVTPVPYVTPDVPIAWITLPTAPSSTSFSSSEATSEPVSAPYEDANVLSIVLMVFFFLLVLGFFVFALAYAFRKRNTLVEYIHEQRLVYRSKSIDRKKARLAKKEKREDKKKQDHLLALNRAEKKAALRIESDKRKEAEDLVRHEKEEKARLEREEQRRIREESLTKQKEELLQVQMEKEAHPSQNIGLAQKIMFWKKHKPISRFYLYQPREKGMNKKTEPSFLNYACSLSDDLYWSHDAEMVLEAVRANMAISNGDIIVMDYETSGAAYRIDASGLHDCPSFFLDHRKSIEQG